MGFNSGFKWLNCYQAKSQRPAYGMLGDVPAHFRDQHTVS